ncbi:hypothetical protein ALQ05_200017 [Pseudomonas amygdali pv. mori]|nr:hypothetical protein ALQ05_200017 [Pseudomonas amygdali pv. mori]
MNAFMDQVTQTSVYYIAKVAPSEIFDDLD